MENMAGSEGLQMKECAGHLYAAVNVSADPRAADKGTPSCGETCSRHLVCLLNVRFRMEVEFISGAGQPGLCFLLSYCRMKCASFDNIMFLLRWAQLVLTDSYFLLYCMHPS